MKAQIKHKIYLHGHLSKFGDTFEFAIGSPAEAIRFLMYQIDGFINVFKDGHYRLVRGDRDNGLEFDETQLNFQFGDIPCDFHIIPELSGSGRSGGGKVIIGAVIMAAAAIGAVVTGGGSFTIGMALSDLGAGAFGVSFLTYSSVMVFGGIIALSGLASLLQPTAKSNLNDRERPADRASFFLSGPVNMVEQGGALPVLYGRFTCGSHILNASLEIVNI